MSTSVQPVKPRLAALDGLRGFAIVLVLFSHTWVVADILGVKNPIFRVFFSSGNYAVAIFFVIGGYLATRSMLAERQRTGGYRPAVGFLRRWLRISAHVYPVVVAVLVLTAIDQNMATYQLNNTRESAWRIITYTWNGYVLDHPLEARPDLGHLWYLCTDLWTVGLTMVLVYILGRHRAALLGVLVALIALVVIYRHHVAVTETEVRALMRISTRADGIFYGAIAALIQPWAQRLSSYAPRIALAGTLLLVPAMWVVQGSLFFGMGNVALNLLLIALLLALVVVPPRGISATVLQWRPMVVLGSYSLVLYVWHYPIFWYLSRNYFEWSWQWRTVVAYLATAVIAVITQRLIERPLQRWLRSESWHAMDHGLLPAVGTWARDRTRSLLKGSPQQ